MLEHFEKQLASIIFLESYNYFCYISFSCPLVIQLTATGFEPTTLSLSTNTQPFSCGFESFCNHLNFRYCACSEQGVPQHSGSYRVYIHSKTRKWHDNNTQPLLNVKKYGAGVEGWVTVNFNIPTQSFTLKLLITFVFQHFLTKRLRHNPHMIELILLELIRRHYNEEDTFNL